MCQFHVRLSQILAIVFLCSQFGVTALAQDEEPSSQFTDMFAAGNFDGWRVGKKGEGWSIENGIVQLQTPKSGSLMSRKKYKNFELEFDWKIAEGGNSGVIFRAQKGRGIEYQLLDDERHVRGKDPLGTTGSIYALVGAPKDKPYKPAGEWNTGRIIADGPHIEHWLNGVKVGAIDIGTPDWEARYQASKYPKYELENFGNVEAPITLQDHGGQVWFRNVKVRLLPERANKKTESGGKARDNDDNLNIQAMISPLPPTAKFIDEDFYIWGGSAVTAPDGKYHLLYSRWPRNLTHFAWVTHSEIAYAVSDNPLGPYKHVSVALPVRGAEHWDGLCTHNPTVHEFDGKYYLYYMGNTGDRQIPKKTKLNFNHRNNQRIGVAVADHPRGPWKRFDKPLIDISNDDNAHDALMTSNPSICRRSDGTYVLIYKAVGKKRKMPSGGPVIHLAATSQSPTGLFKKRMKPLFTAPGIDFPAEDPYIWAQGDRCWAIVNDHKGVFNKTGEDSLALFSSKDGIDWIVAANSLVTKREVKWEDGRTENFYRLERPQLLFENGLPTALFCAAEKTKEKLHSFNLHIPLKVVEGASK